MVVHELQIHKNIRNHNEVFWFSFLVHSKLIASSNILFRSSKSFSFINIFTVGLDYSRQSQLLMGRRIVSWSTSWSTSFLPMKQKIFGITLFIYWNHSYACKINNVIQDYAHKKSRNILFLYYVHLQIWNCLLQIIEIHCGMYFDVGIEPLE